MPLEGQMPRCIHPNRRIAETLPGVIGQVAAAEWEDTRQPWRRESLHSHA